jgi:flavin-dependent dehydrogenase
MADSRTLRRTFAPILVVGAGPAGATAALTLARAGIAVTLIDRSSFPRNKPCGGGISFRVLRRFPYLQRELTRIATHEVRRLHLEGPGGASTEIESDQPAALMIRRVEFDALLVSLAVQAGAELVGDAEVVQASTDNVGVVLTTRTGRRFHAPLVIAADGVHSVVARRLGLNPGWPRRALALDMMEETPRTSLRDVDPETLWVAYGYEPATVRSGLHAGRSSVAPSHETGRASKQAAEGYAYVFPKRDHVNVGIGYVLSYFRDAIGRAPYELQREFVAGLRRREVMIGDSVRDNFTPSLIPVGGPLARPGRGRVLLTGDAGGFVNAFTAEGIYYAMVSGDLAARAIIETPGAPAGHRLANHYRRRVSAEVGAELRDSVLLQRYLFADRQRTARVIRDTPKHPMATRAILDYAIGHRSYASVRRQILIRYPQLAFHLLWEGVKELSARRSHRD